ncbi:MAG: hypothetical protein DRP09_13050 [Candidatus Thorarchaeota archaeon]|nr:MAG: hypothetical protein DRP09_13050 [Candidatus Thorarchaeota archaeon]
MIIPLNWDLFKAKVVQAGLPFKYIEYTQYNASYYRLLASEGTLTYECTIQKETPRNADQTDFEDNYKSSASALTKLPVDVDVIVNFNKYKSQVYSSTTNITLDTTDTTLCTLNFEGKLDTISVNFSRKYVEVAVEIDGTERLRLSLSDLDNYKEFDAGDTGNYWGLPINPAILPVSVVNNGQHFIAKLNSDVSLSVVIKARKLTSQVTKMYACLVLYRKKEV